MKNEQKKNQNPFGVQTANKKQKKSTNLKVYCISINKAPSEKAMHKCCAVFAPHRGSGNNFRIEHTEVVFE